MSRLRPLLLALVLAVSSALTLAAPAAAAQVTVSGVVRGPDGAPAAGLTVLAIEDMVAEYPNDVTDANGSYSVSVDQGDSVALQIEIPDTHVGYTLRSDSFVVPASRVENVTLPEQATVTATVTEGDDGSQSAGAQVYAEDARTSLTSSGGLNLTAVADRGCQTDVSGTCVLRVFRDGSVDQFVIFPSGRDQQNFPGMSTPDSSQTRNFVLAPAPTISGVVRKADGSPLAGAFVDLVGSLTSPVTSGPDGRWSLRAVAGGPYRVSVSATVTAAGWTLPYQFETAEFQHDAARAIDLTLAPLDTVGINVSSSNGVPVVDASVESRGDLSTKSGTTSAGLPFTLYLNRNGARSGIQCRTSSAGRCTLPVLAGGSSGQLAVMPAIRYFPSSPYVPGQPREVTARLSDYALATSAGSRSGTVLGTVDHGDVPDFDSRPIDLPEGLDPVVGRIDYRTTLAPGASSAVFSLDLPNTNANALFRQESDGGLVLLSTWGSEPGFFDVVDGSAADADGTVNGSVSGNIIPVAMAPLKITTPELLPSAAAQKPYSVQLQGSGPGDPTVWSIDPDAPLPAGLTLSTDGTISGTAPALGSYWFRVLMSDSHGWQGPTSRDFLLRVEKVSVLTSSLADAYIGGAYSSTLTFASGSLPSWSVASGSLPPGLKLAAANGTISGTPTTAGTYSFDVLVKANGNTSQRRTLSITVHPMQIATSSLPDAPVWSAYSQKLTTRGGKATLVWSVAGGSLPPGVVLSSAGVLSGKPTTVGSYPVTLKVKDALGQVATRSLAITVTPMVVTTSSLPSVKKGAYYSQLLTVSGGKPTLTWSMASGALPTGLALSSAGRITGYPKAPGTWTFTVKVADSSVPKNTATKTLSVTVS